MLDWTDRHERYFLRLISKHVWLYTEMVTTGAIIHGDADRHLRFDESEHPVALQLGGSEPQDMARCAKIGAEYGYDEININVGCPSERVQKGAFGACLMLEPALVADCVKAMKDAVGELPVTVKHRIGVDKQEGYEPMRDFVGVVSEAGCTSFLVHARNAWLKGLSPKENREIPPLRYEQVYRLKQDFPNLEIIINGGFKDLTVAGEQLDKVDGVMMGREVYHNPYLLSGVDALFYDDDAATPSRDEVLESMFAYIESELQRGARLKHITRHLLGLYLGVRGVKQWRRYLSENAWREGADLQTLKEAARYVMAESRVC